jgi:hypothetical protein
MGADVLAKVEGRWASPRRELGPCLVRREGEPTIRAAGCVYGRTYDRAIKRSDAAHLVVWRRCFPEKPIPEGWTVDHACYVTLCQRPDHLQGPATRAENTRRRHRRPSAPKPPTPTAGTFAIALFARYDRPAVEQRTAGLGDLVDLLTTSGELDDKRQARCWSPTRYADGMRSRANAGVAEVSALVFDLDRVPPEPGRLAGVCWIGHTTWSHRPGAPRWRVVIPLARPVPAKDWAEVWRRARAALCPEADPQCKDASRQYYLPSHPVGVAPEATCHRGPLLDAATLPPLPPEPERPTPRLLAAEAPLRDATDQDRRRAEVYLDKVIRNLASATRPGRNAALNGAAWTLGHWVAAGVLAQGEVEDALFAAAERNGLVADDGPRRCWATIRSGLSKGPLRPIDLAADLRPPAHKRRRTPGKQRSAT